MSISPKAVLATSPATERGRPIVLGGDPKGKKFLYCNGKRVVIRDIANPEVSETYIQHTKDATCAKFSPSGFYIASGDQSGKLRIWDATQPEHLLKYEYQPISGAIKDICWTEDSKRLVVVGEGREVFGAAFLWDSGSSVGKIVGHNKAINSVDVKLTRPFRVVTASEDQHIAMYEGPPFKFSKSMQNHSNFVNVIRYSPDGNYFCSGGADGKVFLFDGKTGETVREFGPPAHKGGIYGLSFSPDSQQVMTCSADKSAKIWDVETGTASITFTLGKDIDDMQVSCLWQGEYLLSVSLSGHINYLDKNNPTEPSRILKGHKKLITSMALSEDGCLYTSSMDSKLYRWNPNTGACDQVMGSGHKSQVNAVSCADGSLYSAGLDETLRVSSTSSMEYGESLALPAIPNALCAKKGGLTIVTLPSSIIVTRNGKEVFSLPVKFGPTCVDVHPDMMQVAVGGTGGKQVHLYTLSGDTLVEDKTLTVEGGITVVQFSPDGSGLAVGDDARKVYVFDTSDYGTPMTLAGHSSRVSAIGWAPDSQHLCSGSLDTHLVLWDRKSRNKKFLLNGAHPLHMIVGVIWLDENTIASAGHDACIRIWNVSL